MKNSRELKLYFTLIQKIVIQRTSRKVYFHRKNHKDLFSPLDLQKDIHSFPENLYYVSLTYKQFPFSFQFPSTVSLSITIGKHSSNVCKYTCSIFNVFISKIDTEIDNKKIFLQNGSDEQEMTIKMASKTNFTLNFN